MGVEGRGGEGREGGKSVDSLKGPLGRRTANRTLCADADSMSHPHTAEYY